MTLQDDGVPQNNTADNPAAETPTQGTFTQADIDRHAAASRKDGIRQGVRDFLADLGFGSSDELKGLLADLKSKQEAEKTEQQRTIERAEAAENAMKALRQEMENERQQNRLQNLRNQAVIEIGAVGVKPERAKHALNLLEADGKLNGLMDEDGAIDDKKLKEVVLSFKKEIPELFGNTATPGTPSNADATASTAKDADKLKLAYENMRRAARLG